jgi:cytochrome b subunit of formate dehydrogenase
MLLIFMNCNAYYKTLHKRKAQDSVENNINIAYRLIHIYIYICVHTELYNSVHDFVFRDWSMLNYILVCGCVTWFIKG